MPKKLPLQGYKVIDASRILVGALSTLMLAEMGADVIKIEQRIKGDDIRHWGPPFIEGKGGKDSTYYMCLNRNKRCIELDLKHPLGKQVVHDLIKHSDIFVQNFPPQTIKKLELDYERVKNLNESLIYASVTGFPENTELANKSAFDLTV